MKKYPWASTVRGVVVKVTFNVEIFSIKPKGEIGD